MSITCLILCSMAASAQSLLLRTYLNDSGVTNDPSKATSYIVYNKISDSLYNLKQYGMDDSIKVDGMFKDPRFSIPNGKFIYYERSKNIPINLTGVLDTLNHIKTIGFFKNGVKDSTWTNYFMNGKIENVNTFKNGILNGLSESYNANSQTIFSRGYFVNGLRDGIWNLYNIHGQVIIVEVYENGKKKSSKTVSDQHAAAVPPEGFDKSLKHKLDEIPLNYDLKGDLLISFIVSKNGDVTEFFTRGTSSDPSLCKKIIAAIKDIKGWKAAYMKNTGELVDEVEIIKVHVAYQQYSAELLNSDEINSRFSQLTH